MRLMNDRSTGFYTVKKSAVEYFNDAGKGKGSGYKQYKRWEWFMEERVYPYGDLSLVSGEHLYNELINFRNLYPASKSSTYPWEPVPMEVYDNVDGHWSPGTGRLDRVMVDPHDMNVIYAGAPSGGLWKSVDGGINWEAKTENLPTIGICGIAIDHTNTSTIYIATGDGDGGGTYSTGIFKSTDGGDTWMPLALTFETASNVEGKKLIIHPVDPQILFFTSSSGIFKTTNAGQSWVMVQEGAFDDIEFRPGNPSIVYATKNDAFYRSENTGDSFARVPVAASGRIIIGVTEAAPSYVYLASGKQGIYLSTDNGRSFEFRGEHPFGKGLKWYMWAFAVSPSDPSVLHIGEMISYRSDDGGKSWNEKTTDWLWGNDTGYTHCDFHEMKYFGNTLYVCTDGGLAKTNDEGESWTVYFNGLETTQVYNIGVCRSDPQKLMFGSQDNGVYYRNKTGWWGWLGADGMDVIYDYNNPATRYATIQNGMIYCSDHTIAQAGEGGWTTPMAIHPDNPEILFIATDVIRKSTDRMVSWTTIGEFGTGFKKALAVAESDPAYIYASEGSRIWKTENGGKDWTEIYGSLPDLTITAIAVHPADPLILAVSFSGYTKREKVYISYDGGSSWKNYSLNLPNIPANTLVFDNNSDNSLYVGMDAGVYYTDDKLSLYEDYSQGLPDVIVRDLEMHYASGALFAGTYGRGVWKVSTTMTGITGMPAKAANPLPADSSQNIHTGVVLEWEPGSQATTHNVHFGTTDPPGLVASQEDVIFDPGDLTAGMTYYWKIDEQNDRGLTGGDTWSFTTDGYCPARGGQGTTSDYISRVRTGDIDNVSGKGYYENFTALSTPVTKGEKYELHVSLDYHWDLDSLNAWIDWNGDKILSAEEAVTMSRPGTDHTSHGSFTVPDNAISGPVRLRVRNIYNAQADPCGVYSGEVEDYTLEVLDASTSLATAAYDPYPADDAINIPALDKLKWTAGNLAVSHNVYFGKEIIPGTDEFIVNQTDTIFDPGLLERSTTYYWRIDELNGSVPVTGRVWKFTTDRYCPSVTDPGAGFPFIIKVKSASTTNETGEDNYTFYTDPLARVAIGQELSLQVTINTFSGNENVYAWIDWDDNNEFDEGEEIIMQDPDGELQSTGTITVPADAVPGLSRLRLRVAAEEGNDPCSSYTGETEDYVVKVLPLPGAPGKAVLMMPSHGATNISTSAPLRWIGGEGAFSHDIFFGTTNPPPYRGNQTDTIFDPGILGNNTNYYWRIDEVNSGGTTTGDLWTFTTFDSDERKPLKVDFGSPFTPVQEGYSAYMAVHNDISSFITSAYGALGADIMLSVSWSGDAVNGTAVMTDRGGDDNTLSPGLLRDWAGTDMREPGNPLKIGLSGLPAGTYKWTSYHHDPHEQKGRFSVRVTDAAGTKQSDDIDISNGSLLLSGVNSFVTDIESDGSDIVLEFYKQLQSGDDNNYFVINAFRLDSMVANGIYPHYEDPDLIKLYPNPARNILNVEYTAGLQSVKMIIYDHSGKQVYSHICPGGSTTAAINLGNYEKGFYTLVIYKQGRFITKKFIVY